MQSRNKGTNVGSIGSHGGGASGGGSSWGSRGRKGADILSSSPKSFASMLDTNHGGNGHHNGGSSSSTTASNDVPAATTHVGSLEEGGMARRPRGG